MKLVDIARVLLARPKILIYEDNSNSSLGDEESSVSIYNSFIYGNRRYLSWPFVIVLILLFFLLVCRCFADCAVVGIAENENAPVAILRL